MICIRCGLRCGESVFLFFFFVAHRFEWDCCYEASAQRGCGRWRSTGAVAVVYALERGAGGLGLLGTATAGCYGAGSVVEPTSCYSPNGAAGTLHHPQALVAPHSGEQQQQQQQTTMTPTSAPAAVAASPNNPVAMSQLGTVYATKRRRRNGKR